MHRRVVNYALAKRSKLADVRASRVALHEVCDAGSQLLRAAQFHGVATESACPICRKEQVTLVSLLSGASLGHLSGSARTPAEIVRLAARMPEFAVNVVEVCRTCRWNHPVRSYVVGLTSSAPSARRAAE